MVYAIISVVTLLGLTFAYIRKILNERDEVKRILAIEAASKRIREWSEQVTVIEGRVKEDEREYNEVKAKFRSDNPESGN